LELETSIKRACVAEKVLFLSAGSAASVGGIALHGVESGAGGAGCGGGNLDLVERGGALRSDSDRPVAGDGRVERAMGCSQLEGISRRR
jgi:hypothetical protein